MYRANVKEIVTEDEADGGKAAGVRLANGKVIRGRTIISHATRWDTFPKLLPADCQCHHIILEDWAKLEDAHGTLFVSIPTLLDPSLSPDGTHIIHAFTPDYLDNWQQFSSPAEYNAKKEEMSASFIERLEAVWPGLSAAIEMKEVATPRTQRRFLNRSEGTYGPIPLVRPLGMLSMPLNTTALQGLTAPA